MPGGSDPGTLAISLGTQAVTNLNNAPAVYTFTPSSAFVLAANTRYVLELSRFSGDSGNWYGRFPTATPTARNGSGYSNTTYRLVDANGSSPSFSVNLFAINGPTVAVNGPEPGTLAFLVPILGAVGSACIVSRRRRK